MPEGAKAVLTFLKQELFNSFSWIYILSVAFFFLFLVVLCLGKLGDIRLGDDDEEPEYSFFSWLCMLFSAGMGIGLMYFGVAEPISHLSAPLHSMASPVVQTKEAMLNTLFHWGIHAWAIYGIIGLSLAYFGFRYRLPVTIRSGFYPLLKHRIYSTPGTVIDILALCATIFGLTTTLGFGAMQLHAGLREIGALSGASFQSLVFIILLSIGAAVLSSISGVGKGVRYLSQGNLILAISLMLFVLLTGPTVYILAAFTENIGYYLTHIVELSFRTFAYESTKEEWFTSWTIMYWAWWISWAPFVGLFIAKISRGRTIREIRRLRPADPDCLQPALDDCLRQRRHLDGCTDGRHADTGSRGNRPPLIPVPQPAAASCHHIAYSHPGHRDFLHHVGRFRHIRHQLHRLAG